MSAVACRACGVATTERVTEVPRSTPGGQPMPPYEVGVCGDCVSLRLDEPGSAVRAALRVIGKPEDHWREAAEVFAEDAGVDVTPTLYERATPQRKPWAHVPREVKEALRGAYAEVLHRRVFASTDKDRPVPAEGPPDDTEHRACLMCGLAKQVEPWRGPVHTKAFTKPDAVTGYLCTACGDAAEAVGAVGPTALERAVMEFHDYAWTENVRIPRLTAWVSTGMGPLDRPWLWVDLAEPTPQIEPVILLRKEVEDLAARVAALEGRQP